MHLFFVGLWGWNDSAKLIYFATLQKHEIKKKFRRNFSLSLSSHSLPLSLPLPPPLSHCECHSFTLSLPPPPLSHSECVTPGTEYELGAINQYQMPKIQNNFLFSTFYLKNHLEQNIHCRPQF